MGWGPFIKRFREGYGIKQIDIARALNVNPVTVSDWERDEGNPDYRTIEKILKMADPDLTLAECLVLPFEASDHASRYRAIAEIVSGLRPVVTAPAVRPRQVKSQPNRGRLK